MPTIVQFCKVHKETGQELCTKLHKEAYTKAV